MNDVQDHAAPRNPGFPREARSGRGIALIAITPPLGCLRFDGDSPSVTGEALAGVRFR